MTVGREVSDSADETNSPLVAALVGVCIVVVAGLAVVGAALIHDRDVEAARAEADARGASAVADGALGVAAMADSLDDLATSAAARGTTAISDASVPGVVATAWWPADQSARTLPLPGDPTVGALRPALDRARDSGDMVVSSPVGDPPMPFVTFALYEVEGSLALEPSQPTTVARRAELAGHVVGAVDVGALVMGPSDVDWRLADGARVLSSSGSVSDGPVESQIDVLGRRWTLSIEAPAVAIVNRSVVPIVLLGAAATGLLLVLAVRWRSERVARAREVTQSRDLAAAIVTLSGVVQESHELGSVLPALSIQLVDHLDLDGLSLATVGVGGESREVFVHGQRPDAGVRPQSGGLEAVGAGETIALHLHRAERSIGVLRVVTGRALGPTDIELLDIAAEMVTSAVATGRSLEQQAEALSRLQSLDQLKSAFLGTASHELRTPVTAISGFTFLLADRWDSLGDAERRVFVERIASNARSLDALVQDLLDFARLERGDHELDLHDVNLSELVVRVLDRSAPVWGTHVVRRSIPSGEGVWARGDVAPLERVVTNLVSNAVKFSPADSEVLVTIERGDRPRLVVDDQGPGVPEEERDKIFARFYRGTGEAVVRTRGVGIGLSLVDDFVTRMGGSVTVDSSPSGGARFIIELEPAAHGSRSGQEERDVAST